MAKEPKSLLDKMVSEVQAKSWKRLRQIGRQRLSRSKARDAIADAFGISLHEVVDERLETDDRTLMLELVQALAEIDVSDVIEDFEFGGIGAGVMTSGAELLTEFLHYVIGQLAIFRDPVMTQLLSNHFKIRPAKP